ncbi:MAG TPA: outer membrane beta-barrel protein [Polyangiaceae bacterium]|nr:outer membrane beta-barrel protein [Polyangiaceae bacterium]
MALRALAVFGALGLLFVPRVARADCPDGWFCDEKPAAPPPQAPPPNGAPPPAGTAPEGAPPPSEEPPEEPPAPSRPARIVLVPPDGYYPEYPPPPPRRRWRFRQELGLNLHLDVAAMGSGARSNAGMAGGGFTFRLRPIPVFALDLGLELLGGNDYYGNARVEDAFVVNALGFVNPRDRLQFYLMGGFDVGGASVHVRRQGGVPVTPFDDSYNYVGAQFGLGLEWRLTPHFALATDFQLFLRARTDETRGLDPEYVDPSTHLATNTSGGGLWRLGATFYF